MTQKERKAKKNAYMKKYLATSALYQAYRKSYMKKYRKVNGESLVAKVVAWQRANPEKYAARHKSWHRRNKERVIMELGGSCACCGEIRLEFLTIDHIGGKQAKIKLHGTAKNQTKKFLRDIIKMRFPKEHFRVLCFNCNCSLGFFGYCPHENEEIDIVGVAG